MRTLIVGPQVVEWVAKRTNEYGNYGAAVGIGLERDGSVIAGVVFNEYNGASICVHVASDGSRRWMTRELLWATFDYAFNQAKVKVLIGLVGSENKVSQRLNKHFGFTLHACIPDAHPDGDMWIYTMRREQCRFLNITRKRHELLKAAA